MTKQPSLSIVIAAYNEEKNIEPVTTIVLGVLQKRFESYELIIVDDGSTDTTGALIDRLAARDSHIKAVHNQPNRGMGYSLWHGMQLATKDYVGSFPGDNAMDAGAFEQVIDLIGQADIVSYSIANPEFRTWIRRFLSASFTALMNVLFGLRLDYYNGHAIYRADLLKKITIRSTGHSFLAEVLVRLLKSGHSFKQIPTQQFDRQHGNTKAFRLGTVLNVLWVIMLLFWELRLRRRNVTPA